MSDAVFKSKAPWIMGQLIADFGITVDDAAAILGNLGHESGGLQHLQELRPVVAGSKGGFGWAQWTGPRRNAYASYCRRNKLAPASDKANYAYLFVELKGPYAKVLTRLAAAKTLNAKVVAFEQGYEQAGVKHYDGRLRYAKLARDAYVAAKPAERQVPAPEVVPPALKEAPIPQETIDAAKDPLAIRVVTGTLQAVYSGVQSALKRPDSAKA